MGSATAANENWTVPTAAASHLIGKSLADFAYEAV